MSEARGAQRASTLMKIQAWRCGWVVFACGAAVGVETQAKLVQVPLPRLATIQAVASNQFMLQGEVVRRTEIDFTMIVRNTEVVTVQVTPDTAILRGGETIGVGDLRPGEKVVASVMRGGEGKLLAVNVTVRDAAGE